MIFLFLFVCSFLINNIGIICLDSKFCEEKCKKEPICIVKCFSPEKEKIQKDLIKRLFVLNITHDTVVLQWLKSSPGFSPSLSSPPSKSSSLPSSSLSSSSLPSSLFLLFSLDLNEEMPSWREISWRGERIIVIKDLISFTEYKFKICLKVNDDFCQDVAVSDTIITHPSGVPRESPRLKLVKVTSHSAHLLIQPPLHPQSPKLFYNITIETETSSSFFSLLGFLNKAGQVEILHDLHPSTSYNVKVKPFNSHGNGPSEKLTFKTLESSQAKEKKLLLIGGKGQVQTMRLGETHEENVINFPQKGFVTVMENFEDDSYIIAFSTKELIILNIKSQNFQPIKGLSADQVAYDWLEKKAYIVREGQLSLCEKLPSNHTCNPLFDISPTSRSLQLDPFKNFLFWLDSTILYSYDIPENKTVSITTDPISAFTLSYGDSHLFVALNDSIVSISYENFFHQEIKRKGVFLKPPKLLVYEEEEDVFIWSWESLVFMEERNLDQTHISEWEISHTISSLSFSSSKPTPEPSLPPQHISVAIGNTSAIIRWSPPPANVELHWKKWKYTIKLYKIKKEAEKACQGKISHMELIETFFDLSMSNFSLNLSFPHLFPHYLTGFVFKMAASINGKTGPWSEYICFKLFKKYPDFVFARRNKLIKFNLMFNEISTNITGKENIRDFHLDSSFSFLSSPSFLLINNSCVSWQPKVSLATSLLKLWTLDYFTNTIYWFEEKHLLIKRRNLALNLEEEEILKLSETPKALKIHSYCALLFWFGAKNVYASRLDGSGNKMIFKVNNNNQKIKWFVAIDNKKGYVFVKEKKNYKIFEVNLWASDPNHSLFRLSFTDHTILSEPHSHEGHLIWLSDHKNQPLCTSSWFTASLFLNTWCHGNINLPKSSLLSTQLVTNFTCPQFPVFPSQISSLFISSFSSSFLTSHSSFSSSSLSLLSISNISWHHNNLSSTDDYFKITFVSYANTSLFSLISKNSSISTAIPMEASKVGVASCSLWACSFYFWQEISSPRYGELKMESKNSDKNVFIMVSLLICLLSLSLCLVSFYKYGKKIRKFFMKGRSEEQKFPCELATLTSLPPSFRQTSNSLYCASSLSFKIEDFDKLPKIKRKHLNQQRFLGSGAFGKVYEGTVTVGDRTTKVAIKTLHRMASEAEKKEFLKEALLMDRFKHNKIIRLLGVCFEQNFHFIIIELMPLGDLLTFLRKSKMALNVELSIKDLLSASRDVAEGCEYLQKMHFVHRDLAARNCLVAKRARKLVVKLGDFGLARDIYTNNYYKKEGEGLLPVRWMAPESLTDGIFTTFSDIWSFGVLVWEIFSLGNQPYPAQTNLDVLNFVKTGGRLQRPPLCSSTIFNLLISCWSADPTKRPVFSQILIRLDEIKKDLEIKGRNEAFNYASLESSYNSEVFSNSMYTNDSECDSALTYLEPFLS